MKILLTILSAWLFIKMCETSFNDIEPINMNGSPDSGFQKLGDIYTCPNREGHEKVIFAPVEFLDSNSIVATGKIVDIEGDDYIIEYESGEMVFKQLNRNHIK
jgi:hypothetical protein